MTAVFLIAAFYAGLMFGTFIGLFWRGRGPSQEQREQEELLLRIYDLQQADGNEHIDRLRKAGAL